MFPATVCPARTAALGLLRPYRFHHLTIALTVAAAAIGCGGGEDLTVPPTTGTLKVTTSTSGTEQDADGYSVQIDTGPAAVIGAAATLTTADITPGNHTVQLGEVAANCTVSGDNPRTVSVTAGETATVSFAVTCNATTTTGSIQVTTTTTGSSLDPDGYTVSVDGGNAKPIGINATLITPDVAAGEHSVALDGLATNCTASDANPRTVTVTAGVEAPVGFTVTCPTLALQWQATAIGTDQYFTSVWGSSATDVFVLGESGGIFHYDGRGWSKQGPDLAASLHGVWGSGPSDVFAVGFGPGSNGSTPYIAHYDGTSWNSVVAPVPPNPFGNQEDLGLESVWGTSGSNVYAVGAHWSGSSDHGFVLHYDGTSWSEVQLPFPDQILHLTDVSGTSPNDVYAVGYDNGPDFPYQGYVLRYDGSKWTYFAYPEPGVALNGVWNSSPSDIFAVGDLALPSAPADRKGVMLHYDGSNWSQMAIPTMGFLLDVWGTSGSDVYAVGDGILHYDGHTWTRVSDQVGSDVWGSSSTDVFVVGGRGTILHGTR